MRSKEVCWRQTANFSDRCGVLLDYKAVADVGINRYGSLGAYNSIRGKETAEADSTWLVYRCKMNPARHQLPGPSASRWYV